MYKLAFCSSSISKYSCLAPTSPLWHHSLHSHLASSCSFFSLCSFPSSHLCCLKSPFFFLLFFSLFLLPLLSVRSRLLWAVPDSNKSANVNHHVLALRSIGCTEKATKSLLIWMWYTPCSLAHSLSNTAFLYCHLAYDHLRMSVGEVHDNNPIWFFLNVHRCTTSTLLEKEKNESSILMSPLALTSAFVAALINNRGSVVSVCRIWMNEIYLHQQFEVFVEVCVRASVCI